MKLREETVLAITELMKKYPKSRSALIPALHLAQNDVGYLPLPIQKEVATLFKIDPNEVHAVVTFYDMFHEEPVGKHVLHVCKNLSCMLAGSDKIIEKMCEKLSVKPCEMTEDGDFTVIPSECLGACDLAPMMISGKKVFGPLKEEELDSLLDSIRLFGDESHSVFEDEVKNG